MLERDRPSRSPTGEPVYDVTFENVQAGLRTDYLFRIANQRGGIVLGTGDLSELALGWATYGVGDQMSHYNVNAGVPEDAHPAPDPLGRSQPSQFDDEVGDDARRDPRHRDQPGARARARSCSRPRRRSARTRCTTSRSSTCCATASGPSKIGFLAWHAWRDADGGQRGRPASPTAKRVAYDAAGDPPLARAVPAALLRVRPVQALGAAERPEGRRPAARCRRAATGGRRRTARPPRGCTTSRAGTPAPGTADDRYAAADEEDRVVRAAPARRRPAARNATATAADARAAIAHPARMSVTKCSPL